MYVSISMGGPKESVVERLRTEFKGQDQHDIALAIAEHVDQAAQEGTSVSVSVSGSISFQAKEPKRQAE